MDIEKMMADVIKKYGHESKQAIKFCERCEVGAGWPFGELFIKSLYTILMKEV